MKTPAKLALAAALGLALATAASAQQEPPDPPAPPGRPGPPNGQRFGQALKRILEKYDANKDGQLDHTEFAALNNDIDDGKILPPPLAGEGRRGFGRPTGEGQEGPGGREFGPPPEILEKYDVNKDGKLDETERAALRKDVEDGKIPPPPGRGRRGPGGPGQAGPPKEILEKYDLNHDGQLDETERAALRKDVEDGKIPPPPHRPAGRGPLPPPASDPADR